MKREAAISLSTTALLLALCLPKVMRADERTGSPAEKSAAAYMVPAQAVLQTSIDARKAESGKEFQAKLTDKVHLKNGLELPKGTVLVGTLATDKMQPRGTSRLALRFTRAEMKDGKAVPIKATIVDISQPGSSDSLDLTAWTPRTYQVDQIGALSGVDLHSNIGASNSGVFVSAKKHDMKISAGSGLALAIEAQPGS